MHALARVRACFSVILRCTKKLAVTRKRLVAGGSEGEVADETKTLVVSVKPGMGMGIGMGAQKMRSHTASTCRQ